MFNIGFLKSRRNQIIAGAAVIIVLCIALILTLVGRARSAGQAQLRTGEVTSITAISSIQTSGPVSALQQATLNWNTTGTVAEVNVKVGDKVKAGDVLMALNPTTAPQNVILAQNDLIAAQKALDEVLHPTALSIANAEKALAEAQQALDKAKSELYSAQNPASQSLYDAVADAKLALQTAQANLQLSNVDPNVSAYNNAVFVTNFYRRNWEQAQDTYNQSNSNPDAKDAMDRAWNAYQQALNNELALQLRISTDQAGKQDGVSKAQEKYDKAVENLNNALAGPDRLKLALAQAKVAAAEAALADAQEKLQHMQGEPDPDDVATATARVQAAQAAVNALKIISPIDGEVLVLNYLPGDTVVPNVAASVVANRSQLHVDVTVDESDVTTVQVGDTATATIDSLPDVSLSGRVTRIDPVGQVSQGLVRYNLRVDLDAADPRVLLGMTANVNIVTDVQANALAVPLDAVQLDKDGEFVMRVKAPGGLERVAIVSGETQEDLVVITAVNGDLQPGDKVQLIEPVPTDNGSPFGPG